MNGAIVKEEPGSSIEASSYVNIIQISTKILLHSSELHDPPLWKISTLPPVDPRYLNPFVLAVYVSDSGKGKVELSYRHP